MMRSTKPLIKSIQSVTLAVTWAVTLAVSVFTIKPASADMNFAGQVCQPANLGQAINLGLSWDQFGINNLNPVLNPVNSSVFFFVICPLQFDDDTDDIDPGFYEIDVVFLTPDAPNVTCTFFEVDQRDNQGVNPIENIQSLVAINPGAGAGPFPRGVEVRVARIDSGNNFAEAEDAISVLCAMSPQTRIEGFRVEGS